MGGWGTWTVLSACSCVRAALLPLLLLLLLQPSYGLPAEGNSWGTAASQLLLRSNF